MAEYVHVPLNEEIRSVSGGYTLEREERIPVSGGEVLYVVGSAMVDSSCCGVGGMRYALVPGLVTAWRVRENERGWPVTEVERIRDPGVKAETLQAIRDREKGLDVQFL